jgi:hypothetical protein
MDQAAPIALALRLHFAERPGVADLVVSRGGKAQRDQHSGGRCTAVGKARRPGATGSS